MRAQLRSLGFSVAVLLANAAPAFAASISVPLDEVRILAFPEPVSTVYVGNPVIADVTVIDSKHVFVLGKSFGVTNLIALGPNGNAVANEHVSVFGHAAATVTLQRGRTRTTYACAARACEAQPVPGDDRDSFATSAAEITAHQDLGTKAAAVGAVASNAGTPQ